MSYDHSGQRWGSTTVRTQLADPRHQIRLQRLARELRLTDQILCDDVEAVVVEEKLGPFPAVTSADGRTIKFSMEHMPSPWTPQAVAVWLGTNAHELGHALFTPRATSPLMRRVQSAEQSTMAGIFTAWNMLEDQRMERLMLGRFASWKGYLTAALAVHIEVTSPQSWLLLAGRTWLPAEARTMSRAMFATVNGDQLAVDVEQLIDGYQRLADPGDVDDDDAWWYIAAFYRLMKDNGMQPPARSGCDHTPGEQGEPVDGDDAQSQAERVPCAADEDDESDAGETSHSDDESDEDDDESEGEGEAEGDEPLAATNADDAAGEGEQADQAEGDAEGDADNEGDDADGVGHGDPNAQVNGQDVLDALKQGVWDQLGDDDTKADLDRVMDAVDNGVPGSGPDGPPAVGVFFDASDKAITLERDVTDALMDLRDEAEPGWSKRTDSGRFNVRRWACDPHWTPDDVFDRYETGQLDACSFEVVTVLDVSGSMQSKLGELGDAAWAIRRAVDSLEGRCTTLTYSDGWAVMSQPNERPDGRVFVPAAIGGTNPVGALREAGRIIAETESTQRLVVVLTDGEWSNMDECAKAVDVIHEADGIVVVAGLGMYRSDLSRLDRVKADFVMPISRPEQLAQLFRDVAAGMMLKVMTG